jgi:hypothetical protein
MLAGMTRIRIALASIALVALTGCATAAPAAPDQPVSQVGAPKALRKNTLHGEMTVQRKDGVRTIVVQRGTVTAVDGRTVTVKSSDGFALTWTLGEPIRVVRDKKPADLSAVQAGAEVGVAGAKEGGTAVARRIVLR